LSSLCRPFSMTGSLDGNFSRRHVNRAHNERRLI
jgi:hypothetical protein